MKTYKIIYVICSLLVIAGAVIQIQHWDQFFGISGIGRLVYILAFLFLVLYQNWYIVKLHKQLKNKE